MYDSIYIIGAGLFGSILAERIAKIHGRPVTIIEKRSHLGGNCWSEKYPGTEIEYHKYGSHIFHTSREDVWKYITQFTTFNTYQHRVYTTFQGRVYSMPINLGTINSYYGLNLTPCDVDAFLEHEKEPIEHPKNLEEKAISLIGRPLYEAFIKGYTQKQWEKDPKELSAEIITRLPVRTSYNNRYFSDKYEGIPSDGYGAIFKKLLSNPLINIQKNISYQEIRFQLPENSLVIYTGAIDVFFDYSFGSLEWRTLDFDYEVLPVPDYQGTSVMNYADREVPFTRIHEFKHYHPERSSVENTVICREYSRFAQKNDEPYYPVATEENKKKLQKYSTMTKKYPHTVFGGRLGLYKYADMDTTIHDALECFKTLPL